MTENSYVNMSSTALASGIKPILKYRGGKFIKLQMQK